jgi:UDP-N-acetylglucosamine diphosphorylase / glucose-1-phosphate thymidylyltransferase / UDP-N-acetylgalactosamine diphosphorylase / glucosamine-1-phosphate N-acetyltransferase / galactosamine-1-phosphate N-acetyltransferase
MELVFRDCANYLKSLLDENEIPSCSVKVFGQPLIIRNIAVASKAVDIDRIKIPDIFPTALRLVQDNFPSINVEEFHDDNDNNDHNSSIGNYNNITIGGIGGERRRESSTTSSISNDNSDINGGRVEIPINSLIHYFEKASSDSSSNSIGLTIDPIVYPWDLLNAIQKTLNQEVTHTTISPNASIAKSSIIQGPCVIEDNVTIDDFCKIKGPVYIGNDSFVGTSSLIRDSMIGSKTKIGFSCEIGRTYLAGDDEIAHLNVIGDSVIGENVWFGGYSCTVNRVLNNKNVQYEIADGKLIDIGTHRFGSIIGNNCRIGSSVVLLPGRYVPPNTIIESDTTFGKKIAVR